MESTSSLPFLVQPTTAQAAHEIILVHGFKIPPEKRTKAARCREALESWVLDAAEPMKTQVNVRVFVYDSAHIFHHGHIAFSEVVANLSKRLEATCAEPFSPLSRQRGANSPTASSSTCSPSRAAIFIAHGIGAWVVKSLLGRSTNQIDPTGLIFLDVLDTPPHQTPLDLPAENFLVEYLRKVSTVFKLHGEEVRIIGLRDKLLEVDHAFQRLADTRYGPCTSINEADTGRCTYSMKMWCENVWMSARSTTVSNETCMKKMNKLLPRANRSKRRMSAPKLDKLQLKGKIREAISMDGFNDPVSSPVSSLIPSTTASSYHTCIDDATLPPLRLSGDGELDFRFPESGDKILSSQESSDWVQKRDKGKGKEIACERERGIPGGARSSHGSPDRRCGSPSIEQDQDGDDAEFYNFDKAIAEVDTAALSGDQDATRLAQHRLELVLWRQQEQLRERQLTELDCRGTNGSFELARAEERSKT